VQSVGSDPTSKDCVRGGKEGKKEFELISREGEPTLLLRENGETSKPVPACEKDKRTHPSPALTGGKGRVTSGTAGGRIKWINEKGGKSWKDFKLIPQTARKRK